MNISTKQSNKIKILSFCSIIFVVWMHAYYLESERWPIIYFAQKFVALFAVLCRAVVFHHIWLLVLY